MLESEISFLKEFELNLQTVESVVTKYFSQLNDNNSIFINLSPLINQQIVCEQNKNNSDYVSVVEFLKLCIKKWQQEIHYQHEILRLKDQVIDFFNTICEELKDEKINQLIRDQRQSIIELIFKLSKFDQKQFSGEFCKGLINGFEIETLNRFTDYATYILWEKFSTPFPVGLMDYISELFKNDKIKIYEESTNEVMKKVIKFIVECFKPIEINISDIESPTILQLTIENALAQRKPILILVEKFNGIESELRNHYSRISYIKIKMPAECFTKEDITFAYEELELNNITALTNYEKIVRKLPKTLRELRLDFSMDTHFSVKEISRLETSWKDINFNGVIIFNLKGHEFDGEKLKALASLFKKIKCKKNVWVDDFNYKNKMAINIDMEEIACVVEELKDLKRLSIDCRGESDDRITNDGIKTVAQILKKIQNLEVLQLNFSHHVKFYTNKKLQCEHLLKNIGQFTDNLYQHFECSKSVAQNNSGSLLPAQFYFYFDGVSISIRGTTYSNYCDPLLNKIDDTSIEELSIVLSEMKSLSKLELDFSLINAKQLIQCVPEKNWIERTQQNY